MKKFFKLTSLFALLLGLLVVAGCEQTTETPTGNNNTTVQSQTDATIDDAEAEFNRQALATDVAAVMQVVKAKTTTFKNLALPTKCANDSVVTWVSSDESVIKSDGTLGAYTNDGLNPDGTLPTAKLTATISRGGLSQQYEVTVEVNRASDYGAAVLEARKNLLTFYEGKELSGYDLSFDANGKAVYTLNFIKRNDVTIKYSSSNRIHVGEDGVTAVVDRPASQEECGGRNYVFDKVTAEITYGTCKAEFEFIVQITIGQQLSTLREIKTLMAEEGWTSEHGGKTEYLFSGTVTLVWESESAYQGFYMEKDGYGMYVYSAGVEGATPRVKEGDEVVLAATLTIYSGLPETSKVNSISIIVPAEENTENIEKITPLEITSTNFTAEGMAFKDGLVASVAKLIYISGTMKSGSSAQLTFRIAGDSKNVTVSCGKYTSDFNNIMNFVNKLKVGDIVEVSKCAVGWYNSDPQLVFTKASYLSKSTTPLTDQEKVALDEQMSELKVAEFLAPSQTYTLPTTTFGSTVNWTVVDADFVTISEGKLVVSEFTQATTVTLKATLSSGDVQGTKEFVMEIPAFVPLTMDEVVSKFEAGTLGTDNFATTVAIYDKVDKYYLASADNCESFFLITSKVELKQFSNSTVLVSKVEKEGSTYMLTVESAPGVAPLEYRYTGENVELSEVTPTGIQKVSMLDVTVANGEAKQNDNTVVKFYEDFDMKNALADGTYPYLEAYVFAIDETTIGAVAIKLTSIDEVNNTAVDKTVTFQGLVVAIMSSGSVLVADNNGDVMTVYMAASYRDGIEVEKFYQFEGKVAMYNDVIQVAASATPFLAGGANRKAPYSLEQVIAKATAIDGNDYKSISADKGTRTLFLISGLTYDNESGTSDTYNNVYLKAKDGTVIKVLNYGTYFGQEELYTEYTNTLAPAKANPAGYTISLVVVDNIYSSDGTLVVQAYPVVQTVNVEAVQD